ncbi:MAG: glycosyltransferase [Deltaproteobacteria bacterium]|nr:glycosyltransferase [Deltaproteobacteria bacterium]
MPGGRPWPKITIVTPSYNQGRYIEETIRSVLVQGYPNLEYIIMDGGSDDNTVEIIGKYEKWLAHWESGPDAGQADALNKGFARATGEIFAYINSDDFYEPGAFARAASLLAGNATGLAAGACMIFNESGTVSVFYPKWPKELSHFLTPFGSTFAQPAGFWTRKAHEAAGGFDPGLHYAFDREFFLKMGLCGIKPVFTDTILARYRDHQETKTSNTVKFYEESMPVLIKYARECGLSDREVSRRLHGIKNDIAYLETFSTWKRSGRAAAALFFARHLLRSPDFPADRKVLGLLRRLLMFPAAKVEELKNV